MASADTRGGSVDLGETLEKGLPLGENDLMADRVDVLLAVAEAVGLTPTFASSLCVIAYESAAAVANSVRIARRNMRAYTYWGGKI